MNTHFEKDYNKLVQDNLAKTDRDSAMAQSIGGNFIHFGIFQRELLVQHGLAADAHLVDVGCGAGRLANALKAMPALNYCGIDVVQELLDYAREISARPDWEFIKVTDFKLPQADASVDMVTAFSLFTHLYPEECYTYLAEFRRVLRPGGKIIFTFLEFDVAAHWCVFAANLLKVNDHLNQFLDPRAIHVWCQHLQLQVEGIFPGDQPHIQLSETVAAADGTFYRGKVALGQSICVLQKPLDARNTIYASLPAGFNADKYLEHNPDVAQSGMDPRIHYLVHGQFEMRRYQ